MIKRLIPEDHCDFDAVTETLCLMRKILTRLSPDSQPTLKRKFCPNNIAAGRPVQLAAVTSSLQRAWPFIKTPQTPKIG